MDLIADLVKDSWEKTDSATFSKKGPSHYKIGHHHEMLEQGTYKYLVGDNEGNMKVVYLTGVSSKKDPLKGIINCDLLIEEDQVLGIDIDGDCVLKKKSRSSLK